MKCESNLGVNPFRRLLSDEAKMDILNWMLSGDPFPPEYRVQGVSFLFDGGRYSAFLVDRPRVEASRIVWEKKVYPEKQGMVGAKLTAVVVVYGDATEDRVEVAPVVLCEGTDKAVFTVALKW